MKVLIPRGGRIMALTALTVRPQEKTAPQMDATMHATPNPIGEGIAKIASVAIGCFLAMPALIAVGVFTVIRLVNLVKDFVETGRFFDACEFQGSQWMNDVKTIGLAAYHVATVPLNVFYFVTGTRPVYSLKEASPMPLIEEPKEEVLALEDLAKEPVKEAEVVSTPKAPKALEDRKVAAVAVEVPKEDFSERVVKVRLSEYGEPIPVTVRGDRQPTKAEVFRKYNEMLTDEKTLFDANPFLGISEFE